MTTPPLVVRLAFRPYWLLISAVATIISTALLFIRHGTRINLPLYGKYLITLALLAALWTWGMKWFYFFRITPTEIKGYNCLGLPRTLPWEEVSEMKPFNFFGIRFVRIYSTKHSWALWFPLQISKRASARANISNLGEKPRRLLTYLERD